MRFVYRTRKQGLLPECTKPKAQSKPGSRGTENLFVAVHRGKVLLYKAYTHWNEETACRCWLALRDRYREEYGVDPVLVPLLHDRDSSMKSKKSQRRARYYGFDPLWLPVRSAEDGVCRVWFGSDSRYGSVELCSVPSSVPVFDAARPPYVEEGVGHHEGLGGRPPGHQGDPGRVQVEVRWGVVDRWWVGMFGCVG